LNFVEVDDMRSQKSIPVIRIPMLLIVLSLIFTLVCSTVPVFADETLTGSITPSEIEEGLAFCSEYPAILKYDGQIIEFPEDLCPPTIIRNRTLIPARQLFEAMGGSVDWQPESLQVEICLGDSTVALTIGSNKAIVNGKEKGLEVPALIIDHDGDLYGSTMIPLRFVSEELGYTVVWNDDERTANIVEPAKLPALNETAASKLICIDPGHGGADPGAIGHEDMEDEIYESDINLEVALILKKLLEASGARVIMTRESDIKIGKYDRVAVANNAEADLFVSIHNNSSDSSSTNGTTTYYCNKIKEDGSTEIDLYGFSSETIAAGVQQSLQPLLGTKDNGIVQYPELAVLNKTYMPAIVIEGAYLSNEGDFALISKDDYVYKYAYGVASGLIIAMNDAMD